MSFKFCYANVQTSRYQVATGSVSMIRSVVLPDGTSYAFEYNDLNGTGNINYGSLTKITLPTGGPISYTYVDHDTNGLRYPRSKHSFRDDDHQPVCCDRTVTDHTRGAHVELPHGCGSKGRRYDAPVLHA